MANKEVSLRYPNRIDQPNAREKAKKAGKRRTRRIEKISNRSKSRQTA
jgi:hypothetical protein